MTTLTIQNPRQHTSQTFNNTQDIIALYEHTMTDYQYWSKDLHMHYGFAKNIGQWFSRSKMLNQMTLEVLKRLKLNQNKRNHLVDFGCGMGQSMRQIVKHDSTVNCTGLNIVAGHIKRAKHENRIQKVQQRIQALQADYHKVPLPSNTAQGCYAIESLCHAYDKKQVVREIRRVLQEKGKLVLADCFLKVPKSALNGCLGKFYDNMCRQWHVPDLLNIDETKSMLLANGFENIKIENVSRHVAPSVFYSPFLVAKFAVKLLLTGGHKEQWKNLKGVIDAMILGMHLNKVGYFLVTAEKA